MLTVKTTAAGAGIETRTSSKRATQKMKGVAPKVKYKRASANVKLEPLVQQTFLLDKASSRYAYFSKLHPQLVSSVAGVRDSVAQATKNTLWISYAKYLTEKLLETVIGAPHSLGKAIFLHKMSPQTLPAIASCFKQFAFTSDSGFLPPEELAEALESENSANLFIGGSVDPASQTITLWRGNLDSLRVPFSAFEKSGDGTMPNFKKFSVTDSGQTIRLGDYEAAADAVLYEFDRDYRRQISRKRLQSEQSLGAALRRLRKQRGLRREDFAPGVAAKTIARIEQGLVHRIQKRTLDAIADRLRVKPEEIKTY